MSEPGPMEQWVEARITRYVDRTWAFHETPAALLAFAREQDAALAAKDERIAELTAALEGIMRHRTTVADCQCVHHEAARAALAPIEVMR